MRTVARSVPRTREETINVVSHVPVEKTEMRTVCRSVARQREVNVDVVTHVPVEKTEMRTVCRSVARQREVNVERRPATCPVREDGNANRLPLGGWPTRSER